MDVAIFQDLLNSNYHPNVNFSQVFQQAFDRVIHPDHSRHCTDEMLMEALELQSNSSCSSIISKKSI
jgi:hypothetical protein